MKKVSNNKDTYKVNEQVTVNVVNKRIEDFESGSVHYERTVTVKISAGKFAEKPLSFDEAESLTAFIELGAPYAYDYGASGRIRL